MMGLVTGALGAFLSLVGLFCFIASDVHYLQALLPTGFGKSFCFGSSCAQAALANGLAATNCRNRRRASIDMAPPLAA